MNICEHLLVPAKLFPKQTAIIFEDHQITYSELATQSEEAAKWLIRNGVQAGDRIAILLPNVPAFAVWYFAIARLRAIVVSLSTRLAPSEVGYLLDDCDASILVSDKASMTRVADSLPNCVGVSLAVDELGSTVETQQRREKTDSDVTKQRLASWQQTTANEPALILYTSGTTGFAKGATLSHQNVRATVHAFNHLCGTTADDRVLLAVPLFHCFGQNALLNSCLNVGATLVLQRQFDPLNSKRLIQDNDVTQLYGVPTMFRLLADCCDASELSTVNYCFSAAATLPIQLADHWQSKFGMPIYEGYGLTETAPFASYNHKLCFKSGSIGTPVDLVEMKVVDTETGQNCASGEVGEIAIRGPNVMLGYWNRVDETAKAIRNGWFHSGDVGYVDEEGFFYLVDRLKDMIVIGGLKLFPAEVERVLLDHSSIADVAVVGFPDELLGERAIAFYVATESNGAEALSEESLKEYCREKLADYKRPKAFIQLELLPRNPSGKILKTELRKRSLPLGMEAGLDHTSSPASDSSIELTARSLVDQTVPTSTSTGQSVSLAKDFIAANWRVRLTQTHASQHERLLTQLILDEVDNILGRKQSVQPNQKLVEEGLDSLAMVELRDRVQRQLGDDVELPATLAFDYPRVMDLAAFLVEMLNKESKPNHPGSSNSDKSKPTSSYVESPPVISSSPFDPNQQGEQNKTLQGPESGVLRTGLQESIEAMSEQEAIDELMRELED